MNYVQCGMCGLSLPPGACCKTPDCPLNPPVAAASSIESDAKTLEDAADALDRADKVLQARGTVVRGHAERAEWLRARAAEIREEGNPPPPAIDLLRRVLEGWESGSFPSNWHRLARRRIELDARAGAA